jgi:hypothetical protein
MLSYGEMKDKYPHNYQSSGYSLENPPFSRKLINLIPLSAIDANYVRSISEQEFIGVFIILFHFL